MKPFGKVKITKAPAGSELMTYLTLLGNKGDNVPYLLNFSKPTYYITNDILNDFLLCRFLFNFSETKINTENIKNSLPLKPTSFHRPSTDTFSKFGNEAIGNVSFQYT